jgi:transcription elongation factor Elf1
MSKASKTERSEIYKDHRVQLLLSKFTSKEISNLEPVYDPIHGYKYPVVEAMVGTQSEAEAFLENLSGLGVLKKELFDRVVYCPSCDSANVSIRYSCPLCKAFNIRKSSLIEHVKCGYIDTEEHFRVGNKLVCPRCNKELTKPEVDYRKAGVWCTCNECGKSFDMPIVSHLCRNCQKSFMFEDAVYNDVYSYSISAEAIKEASLGLVLIAPIREFLEKRDFKVETPGFLKGASGTSHTFDITASKEEISKYVAVFDIATSTGDFVTEQPVIALFAKVYDVAPDKACLVAIPRTNESGKKLANLYKINLVEAKDQKEVIKALQDLMQEK